MDRRSAAKGVMDPAQGDLRRSPMTVGPRRPTSSARPFDGTTGG
jgi:hypothetical protein